MPIVTVKQTNNFNIFRASVDEVRQRFDDEGVATKRVAPGKHYLSWLVIGNPGSKYSIGVTIPPDTGCHGATPSNGLDDSGIDFGACTFTLGD